MASADASSDTSKQTPDVGLVDLNLEVVTLFVSDVDQAKSFYQGLGWRLDADIVVGDDWRVVQLTPPIRTARSSSGTASRRRHPGPPTGCSSRSRISMPRATISTAAAPA